MKPGIYKHYKGNFYTVISIARHSETLEEMVVYKNNKDECWVRPRKMFEENVLVEGKEVARFEFQSA